MAVLLRMVKTQKQKVSTDGKMYVFDERISVDVNHVDKTVIGKEHFDGTPCERYINCANPECNKQILVSEK